MQGATGADADLDGDAVHVLDSGKAAFVGSVVTQEKGGATLERRLLHEGVDGDALVDARQLDVDDAFAEHDFEPGVVRSGDLHRVAACLFPLRGEPVVHRYGRVLAFHDHAGVSHRQGIGGLHHGRQVRRSLLFQHAVRIAALCAMLAGRRQRQRFQEAIERIDLTTRDDGQRSAQQVVQGRQRLDQCWRDVNGIRRLGDVDQRAVEIEKQCRLKVK